MARWLLRFAAALSLAWLVLFLSPYVALYNLARAVEHRDAGAIEERANLRSIRLSLTRQLTAAAIEAFGAGREVDSSLRQLTSEVASGIAEPLLDNLLIAQGIIDLFDDGWPQGVLPGPNAMVGGLTRASLQNPWRVFVTSRSRGFRSAYFFFPLNRPRAERFRLQLRLTNWSWRLVEVDLPPALLQRLVRELARARGLLDKIPGESPIGLRP
jgi:hypothetical protein